MVSPRLLAFAILLAAGGATTLAWWSSPRRPTPLRARPTPRPAPVASRPTPLAPRQTPTAAAPYVIKRVLDTHGPIAFGRWFWDEADVPAGPILITVDTGAEVLSVFRGGYEIGTTAVIYGADHKPTPLGVFPILAKYARHFSSTYGGAPMPYTLRLTNDGVSIHGSAIDASYATHGCIGVPKDFARKLFGAVKIGDRVVVTRGEQLAVGGTVTAVH